MARVARSKRVPSTSPPKWIAWNRGDPPSESEGPALDSGTALCEVREMKSTKGGVAGRNPAHHRRALTWLCTTVTGQSREVRPVFAVSFDGEVQKHMAGQRVDTPQA